MSRLVREQGNAAELEAPWATQPVLVSRRDMDPIPVLLQSLRTQLQTSTSELEAARSEHDRIRKDAEFLTSELNRAVHERDDAKSQISFKMLEISTLNSENARLKSEVSRFGGGNVFFSGEKKEKRPRLRPQSRSTPESRLSRLKQPPLPRQRWRPRPRRSRPRSRTSEGRLPRPRRTWRPGPRKSNSSRRTLPLPTVSTQADPDPFLGGGGGGAI